MQVCQVSGSEDDDTAQVCGGEVSGQDLQVVGRPGSRGCWLPSSGHTFRNVIQ